MLIPILMKYTNIHTVFLGGDCNPTTATTSGYATMWQIGDFIADVYFIGACAVDSTFGFSAPIRSEAEVKRAMRDASKKIIALANHELLRRTEAFKIWDIDQVDTLITNLPGDSEELDEFRAWNIRIA